MAVIRKRGKTWQAMVRLKGHPCISSTHPTKRHAEEWARAEEGAIQAGKRGAWPVKTVDQALTRYADEVSSQKRSGDYELKRIEAFRRDFPAIAAKVISTVTPDDIAKWRNARLKKVTPGTVQRDANLFRHVWTIAGKEWGWCSLESPWSRLKMPGNNPARDVVWSWPQIRAVVRRAGHVVGLPPQTAQAQVAAMFMLSLQTCMRQGEIYGLTVKAIDLEARVIRLDIHKTVEKAGVRHVPVPRRAIPLLRLLCKHATDGRLFTVAHDSVDTLFRRMRTDCAIKGLTFHDARATAATLLARRVDPLTLARIMGHRDLKQLIDCYWREPAAQIAARL